MGYTDIKNFCLSKNTMKNEKKPEWEKSLVIYATNDVYPEYRTHPADG